MSTKKTNSPLPVGPPPGWVGSEFAPLLSEPFARAWARPGSHESGAHAVRERLLGRLAQSRATERAMFTARRRRLASEALAVGVRAQTLYLARMGQTLRPGEPLRARLIEVSAGAQLVPDRLDAPATLKERHCEWLVLSGSVQCADEVLSQRDYHVTPAGHEGPTWISPSGALLFLRESNPLTEAGDIPFTVRDADACWPAYAPGIQRRVLWQQGGQAALLYYAQAGAQVPHHHHGHDEECLMLQGELFLDDLLLQPGDYQLAPAGTGHRVTETDTGVVLYTHGDLDLNFVA